MKQPYIYSMPESFLRDKSVPARWRVLAVINGFILNGGCFYGSNGWLMDQLGCSEPTVSSAFKELEVLQEIRTERTKRTRKVYKTMRDPSSFGSETQVEPARDPSQLVPNSVSNSEIEEVRESEDAPREPSLGRISKEEKATLLPIVSWAERERGFPFLTTEVGKQMKALSLARKNGIKGAQLKERWEEMAADTFWARTGFDWMNVVMSFNKKV